MSCGVLGARSQIKTCSSLPAASHTQSCSLFPGLAALVSLYGLVFDTAQIEKQVGALSGILPAQTQELLSQQLHSLVEASSGALGLGAVVGLVLALWSASRGMSGLITAINIAYEEKERRGFFKLNMIALGLTLGLISGASWRLLSWRYCRPRCSSSLSAPQPNGS